jgi:hypothetical protein
MGAAGWTETTELHTKQLEDHKIAVCTVAVGRIRGFTWTEGEKMCVCGVGGVFVLKMK